MGEYISIIHALMAQMHICELDKLHFGYPTYTTYQEQFEVDMYIYMYIHPTFFHSLYII